MTRRTWAFFLAAILIVGLPWAAARVFMMVVFPPSDAVPMGSAAVYWKAAGLSTCNAPFSVIMAKGLYQELPENPTVADMEMRRVRERVLEAAIYQERLFSVPYTASLDTICSSL